MNHRTAKERLLENLPPEQRPYFDRCLHRLSPSPDDPLIALFAILTESDSANTAVIEAKLEAFEQRDKQLREQLAKDHKDQQKTLTQGFGAVRGRTLWKHLIASRIIGAVIWIVMVASLTSYVVKKQVGTVDPKFHKQLETVAATINERTDAQAQFNNLRTDQLMDLVRESNKTHVTTASQTLIGKSLSLYVTRIDEKMITLEVDKRRITVPHNLTPQEFLQLDIARQIASKIQ